MQRIFAAIDIADETRALCAAYSRRLRNRFTALRVGWEKPEKMHLTLKFLGELNHEQIGNLIAAAEETARQTPPFEMALINTGVFPSGSDARVLWLGVADKQGSLQSLRARLEIAAEARGFQRETRKFYPHLTVARLREPENSARLIEEHLENEFTSNEFTVSAITIYASALQKSGAVYTPLAVCRLFAAREKAEN